RLDGARAESAHGDAFAPHGAEPRALLGEPARGGRRIEDAVAGNAERAREAEAQLRLRFGGLAGVEDLRLDARLRVNAPLRLDVLHLLRVGRHPERAARVVLARAVQLRRESRPEVAPELRER